MKAALEASYVEFVTSRQRHLGRIAYAVTGDRHKAEDLLQNALVKLYRAWPRVQRNGAEEAYVRQIIIRTSIDDSRRGWFRKERVDSEVAHSDRVAAGGGTAPEIRDELFTALQALPPMQRKVVVLRHWLELSVSETAHELGISPGTVKSHSSRGLEALRRQLATVAPDAGHGEGVAPPLRPVGP